MALILYCNANISIWHRLAIAELTSLAQDGDPVVTATHALGCKCQAWQETIARLSKFCLERQLTPLKNKQLRDCILEYNNTEKYNKLVEVPILQSASQSPGNNLKMLCQLLLESMRNASQTGSYQDIMVALENTTKKVKQKLLS